MAKVPFGFHKRWTGRSAEERSAHGRMMRYAKGRKRGHVTQRAMGHYAYLRLCQRYKRQLGRPLTPAERAHIRVVHAEEIAASCVGWPWPKKPRSEAPGI